MHRRRAVAGSDGPDGEYRWLAASRGQPTTTRQRCAAAKSDQPRITLDYLTRSGVLVEAGSAARERARPNRPAGRPNELLARSTYDRA